MGLKPMTISQNIIELMKNQSTKAFEIQAMMGFKPMTLQQNIIELMKNQSSKPWKFML